MTNSIALISSARAALEKATSVIDVLDISDKAKGLQEYLKASGESLAVQNQAAAIRLRASRKAGQLIAEMEKSNPGSPKKGLCDIVSHKAKGEQLAEVGLSRKQASRLETMAIVPDEIFEVLVSPETTTLREKELTGKAIFEAGRKIKASQAVVSPQESNEEVNQDSQDSKCLDCLDDVRGKFGTIYADPPWQYGNQGTRASTDKHYSTMTIDQLCEMPIASLAADNSHLHLWTTNAFLFDARKVMDAWGFTYKSCFIWVKPQMGIGNYWRVSHEFLLLGVRGDAKRFAERNHMSWASFDRGRHSAKPEKIRHVIERVSPGPFLELFGRMPVAGWTVFGNQIEKRLIPA